MTREVCEHFNPVDQPCAKCEEKRKSEALFLADELEIPLGTVIQSEVCRRAAKELRRLHAELGRCKQVCAATSEAWREEAALGCDHCNQPLYAAVKCRVCGRVTEPVQEPVAVVRSVVGQGDDGVRIKWLSGFPQIGDRLYTAPPQRKPLTEEALDELAMDEDGLPNSHLEFARAIERAHGIGGNDE